MNQQITIKKRKEINTQIMNLTGDIGLSVVFSFHLLMAVLVLMTIPERYQAEVAFHSRALSTTGIIIETKRYQSCSGSGLGATTCTIKCNMKVKFKSNAGNSTIFWEDCSVNANKNQLISVLYDPKKNSNARVFCRNDTPKSRAVSQLTIGLFIALMGSFYLHLLKEALRRS
jgi:hypothetical protein